MDLPPSHSSQRPSSHSPSGVSEGTSHAEQSWYLPPRQLPSERFLGKQPPPFWNVSNQRPSRKKEKALRFLGGFILQPLNEKNHMQHQGVLLLLYFFSLLNVLLLKWFFFFSNCLGLELFVVFCADFTQLKWSSHGPSLSLMTLRNPNTCYKKKIKLQNILRCTDALWEGRWSQGRHAWGRELSEISWTAEGSLFADHRSAVPLSRDTFGAERGGAYIFFLRCQSCAKSLTCFTLQINVLWSRYY